MGQAFRLPWSTAALLPVTRTLEPARLSTGAI